MKRIFGTVLVVGMMLSVAGCGSPSPEPPVAPPGDAPREDVAAPMERSLPEVEEPQTEEPQTEEPEAAPPAEPDAVPKADETTKPDTEAPEQPASTKQEGKVLRSVGEALKNAVTGGGAASERSDAPAF